MVRRVGDREHLLVEVFGRDYAALCRLAFVVLGDKGQAEDSVMEAFARTCRSWAAIRDQERAGLFVRRAVINETRNRLRKRGNEAAANRRWSTRPSSANSDETDDDVLTAVRALPPRQRAAVVLHYLEDLSEKDVAAVLGCTTGTVKSQLAKARTTLGRRLHQDAHT